MSTLISIQSLINFIGGILVGVSLEGNEIISLLPTPFLIIMMFYHFVLDTKFIIEYVSVFVIVP